MRTKTTRATWLSLVTAAAVMATALTLAGTPGVAFAASAATIDGSTTFQTIAGFGASEAFGEASAVMNASSSVQQQALDLLYSPTSGAGLNILRNEIGADPGSTIEPNNPGGPSATPNYVPLSQTNQDQGQLWFAQQIKSRYGVNNVFADAWSAPAFMKTNGATANGGQVCGSSGASCGSGDWRQAYANYLVQYAKDYAAAGVPLSYLGPSNEPDFSANYDSMTMSPAQMTSLLDVVGPTVSNSGLSTKVNCCAATGWPVSGQYAAAIESDPTALANTALLTSHGYSGAPNSRLAGWTKSAWETEWSTFEGWDPAWDDGTDASGLTWAQHIYTGLTSTNLNAFLYWWGSTTTSENGDNEGLLEINGSSVVPTGRLWAFANYSRYIHPGATRIGASTSDGNLELSAYRNTDGTVAVVALNTGSSADPVTYALRNTATADGATVRPHLTNSSNNATTQATMTVSGGAFSATVPARSLVTYVVSGSGTTGNQVSVTDPGNQTGTTGTAVTLAVQAADSAAGQTLTYGAIGLPAGLTINPGTGVITGKPTTTATSSVTVTATDGTGASGSAGFTWTITSSGGGGSGGAVHAVGAGKCLDVSGASTNPGTQLEISGCSGAANQQWTHSTSSQLTVYSGSSQLCLDANGQGTSPGTKVVTWTCNGQANQQWQVNANGTITGVQSGLCLDVSGASTADGALVELWTCNGGSNQQWTLG